MVSLTQSLKRTIRMGNGKILFLVLNLLSFVTISKAQELEKIKLFTTDRFIPQIIYKDSKLSGIMGEFLLESTKNIATIEVHNLPWPRAQKEAIINKNSLLAPFTRNHERENKVKWVAKVYEDPVCVFTVKPNKPMNSKEDILKLKDIGMALGSASYAIARVLGVEEHKIASSQSNDSIAKKLEKNRIGGWLVSTSVARSAWQANKFDPNILQCGKPVAINQLYFATSLKSDDSFVKKSLLLWRAIKKLVNI